MANEKTKVEIKGIPIWEDCNKQNDSLQNAYDKLEKEFIKLYKERERINERLREIKEEYKRLNIEEVNNVLDYVRTYRKIITPHDIDMYLCHCQNKLNGNIDSIFLTFEDPKKYNKNEN